MAEPLSNFWVNRRIELRKSQRAMATTLGVSNSTVANWEALRIMPTEVSISDLAIAYESDEETIERALIATRRAIEARAQRAAERHADVVKF